MNEKVSKLKENSKNKNTREMYKGINEFKKGFTGEGSEVYVAETDIPEPSLIEVELTIEIRIKLPD